LIRLSKTFASAIMLAAFALPLAAQQVVPAAPTQDPSAPTPNAAPVFPKPDPANFTAASPTKETVDAFFAANWGFDENRIWQVEAIYKTNIEGISKVIVYVGDKTGKQKPQAMPFFALPDGKHIIVGDQIINFGTNPFAVPREEVKLHADGPSRGAESKDLEIVEFADFQCPHCKLAQDTMEKLVVDYPKAHIVFQNYPLTKIHASAYPAAAYGVCVAKLGGNKAFFTYAAAVFEGQEGLGTADGATLTLNSSVSKAGLDPVKVEACSKLPATKATVDASVKLAEDLEINETPTLMVNGRSVPATAPYDVLKQIIDYQAKMDGVATK
jgi:protein-disulfide isomerase